MLNLSKTKLLAWRQCPRRLWLEVHRPDACQESSVALVGFAAGHQVGDIARRLYDPRQRGQLIDPQAEGFDAAFARTRALLRTRQPIFEAGFHAKGALAFADVLLPTRGHGWRMVDVKSYTCVKDYHRDDAAVQCWLARACGVPLRSVALAHIDSQWTYPGHGDHRGLLVEQDLTEEAFARMNEVRGWIAQAQAVVARSKAPRAVTGGQCGAPYECGFLAHCQSQQPRARHPAQWLTHPGSVLRTHLETHGTRELPDVPDDLLNPTQQRVKIATLSGRAFFDQRAAAQTLAAHRLPGYFLDFGTIQFAVPIWRGTRSYQQILFQFSVHRLGRTGRVAHSAFLDLTGGDPAPAFARALVGAYGERGPVFVYNAAFETARIREPAQRHQRLAPALQRLNARIVDLLPIACQHYYHPSQQGSWSIKAVLAALCPELRHNRLDGVQDGAAAQQAYVEAIAPATRAARKAALERQLLAYCQLDSWAMVRLWAAFTDTPLKA